MENKELTEETVPCEAVEMPSDAVDGNGAEPVETERIEDRDCPVGQNGNTEAGIPDVDRLVAEAEERGYLRGRNERIEELMKRPGVFEPSAEERSGGDRQKPEVMILNNMRHSVWA